MDSTGDVPGICRVLLWKQTPLEDILDVYQRQLRSILNANPDIKPVTVFCRTEMLESQNRMMVLKSQHKKSIGYVSEEELFRSAAPGQDGTAKKVAAEIEKIKQKKTKNRGQTSFSLFSTVPVVYLMKKEE